MGYQELAEDGFAVLGERLRGGEERDVVAAVLQKVLGAKVGVGALLEQGWSAQTRRAAGPGHTRQPGRQLQNRQQTDSAHPTLRLLRLFRAPCCSWILPRLTAAGEMLLCSSSGRRCNRRLLRLQLLMAWQQTRLPPSSSSSSSRMVGSSAAHTAWQMSQRCVRR